MRCPTCRDDATDSSALPFCSERCRRMDLAKWVDGSYRIPGEHVDLATFQDHAGAPLPLKEQT